MSEEPRTKDIQLKLRFGEALRDRLATAASINGSSLNSEIVRRLEASLSQDEAVGGTATALLQANIAHWIKLIQAETQKLWTDDLITYGAVKAAIEDLVDVSAPVPIEYRDKVLNISEKFDLALRQVDAVQNATRSDAEMTPEIAALLLNATRTGDDAQAEADAVRSEFERLASAGRLIFERIKARQVAARVALRRSGRGA